MSMENPTWGSVLDPLRILMLGFEVAQSHCLEWDGPAVSPNNTQSLFGDF